MKRYRIPVQKSQQNVDKTSEFLNSSVKASQTLLAQFWRSVNSFGFPLITLVTSSGLIAAFLTVEKNPCPALSYNIVKAGWKSCLIYAHFSHFDEWHLWYNIISFVWKGIYIESQFGSLKFLLAILLFIPSVGLTFVTLSYLLARITMDDHFLISKLVGFSGVIMALKVLSTEYWHAEPYHSLLGIPLITKYLVWIELVFLPLLVPNLSLICHSSGIIVGLLYTLGFLRIVVDIACALIYFLTPGLQWRKEELSK
ncbi:hypothetical protein B4U79_05973 [Dinothrombium tinctorium]|uniref:Peptidase S54 rhomboid domain-containing protein n=1 Tax=Dinothrombium tinctorium TaxID=1965070 RepID=A0A3S3SP81_9ACAR|nr:hypothetical protein B4U79_02897 [Dinothrombium tinctorium]RWS16975.1 hypothetical protein B4U79_02725 [Dinothrombium tinctorium]RWS17022.1 hypothetical protein B4U79_05973 [Dinothrombium tinctorium]